MNDTPGTPNPLVAAQRRMPLPRGLSRFGLGAAAVTRDTITAATERVLRSHAEPPDDALERCLAWLRRTHQATGRRGSSKGFSVLHGWLPAYPETTGYVIGTMLRYASLTGDAGFVEDAVQMGDWEIEVQRVDGGVLEGAIGGNDRSIVFNTGMVMHGWVDLATQGHGDRYLDAAVRAADFLKGHMRSDGTWDPRFEYSGIAHTYNSRVAWAMLRLGVALGENRYDDAARRQLDWVVAQQRSNGWYDSCIFKPGGVPSTHGLAYTMRGLLESHAITQEQTYLDAAVRSAEVLMRKMEVLGNLPANYDSEWRPAASYECVTGTAQMGGIWLRLFQITGDARYLNAGLKGVEQASTRQRRSAIADLDGAVPGSFPVYGRYAPMQYPNWAAKFLSDSLMLRDECLSSA